MHMSEHFVKLSELRATFPLFEKIKMHVQVHATCASHAILLHLSTCSALTMKHVVQNHKW